MEDAQRRPVARGLLLFASQAVAESVRLPHSVEERVSVERTFATRELVRTLHRTPLHVFTVISPLCAHFYRGNADTLVPVNLIGTRVEHQMPVFGRLTSGAGGM